MSASATLPTELQESPLQQRLREDTARMAVRLAHRFGFQIKYQDREGDPIILLWALPGDVLKREDEDQIRLIQQVTTTVIAIPRQYCGIYPRRIYEGNRPIGWEKPLFPVQNEPSTNAKIWYVENGVERDWNVTDDKGWTRDAPGAVYSCTITRNQARRTDM